jgi:tetratricopeptide (TPR) repeat protein
LTLADFRKRLVSALVKDEPPAPLPRNESDVEGLQQYLGVRYLLLAPLFGYVLQKLIIDQDLARVEVVHDGVEETYPLSAFRARLRTHVRQEHERIARGQGEGAIDLGRVSEAEDAAAAGDHRRVAELLGAWPAPLAIFLRTPEGQALGHEARETVARGLSLLGSACVEFEDFEKAEEILRLAVQYAGEGPSAGDVYYRLGLALLVHGRPGEAIGPLRRALALGATDPGMWPALGRAFLERGRNLAAMAVSLAAVKKGVPAELVRPIEEEAASRLRGSADAWAHFLDEKGVAHQGSRS